MALDQYGNETGQDWPDYGQQGGGPSPEGGMFPNEGDLRYEIGELPFQSDLIEMMVNNPQYKQLWDQLMTGFDPDTRAMIDSQIEERQKLIDADPAYSQEQRDKYGDLISGDYWDSEMEGSLKSRTMEAHKSQREAAKRSMEARGISGSAGAYGATMGRLGRDQMQTYTNAKVDNLLRAIGIGTEGLGMADNAMLNRSQTIHQQGSDVRNFVDNSQLNRMNIGTNIANSQQNNLMNLLGMSQDQRASRGPSPIMEAIAQYAPYAFDLIVPGSGAAMGAMSGGLMGGEPSTSVPGGGMFA